MFLFKIALAFFGIHLLNRNKWIQDCTAYPSYNTSITSIPSSPESLKASNSLSSPLKKRFVNPITAGLGLIGGIADIFGLGSGSGSQEPQPPSSPVSIANNVQLHIYQQGPNGMASPMGAGSQNGAAFQGNEQFQDNGDGREYDNGDNSDDDEDDEDEDEDEDDEDEEDEEDEEEQQLMAPPMPMEYSHQNMHVPLSPYSQDPNVPYGSQIGEPYATGYQPDGQNWT